MIGIIETPWGNKSSLECALERVSLKSARVSNPSELNQYQKIILPGVGNFETFSQFLSPEWRKAIVEYQKPFLGICLGMQALFEGSAEGSGAGLGVLKGRVEKLPIKPCPHMGWNSLLVLTDNLLTQGIGDEDVYFVHSFAANLSDQTIVKTEVAGFSFASVVNINNFWGVQFHPEKSGEAGLRLLKNFGELS